MGQRPSVGLKTARTYRYMAALVSSDTAPLHGDCSDPYVIELAGQQSILLHRLDQWSNDTEIDYFDAGNGRMAHTKGYSRPALTTAYVSVRCRKCTECLRKRARLWTARAIDEICAAKRTWFGTLTLRPEEQFLARLKADKAADKAGSVWRSLSADEQHKDIVKVISPEITRWIKRVRKNSGAYLRYLLVSERHKSGDPHFHILIHEYSGSVTKRVLDEAWKLGFSQFKLCDQDKKAAVYVCKYLAKSAIARIRPSNKYGTAGPRLITDSYIAGHAARLAQKRSSDAEENPLSKKNIEASRLKL